MKAIEIHCAACGDFCQGFPGHDGKFYCQYCYYKIYGE